MAQATNDFSGFPVGFQLGQEAIGEGSGATLEEKVSNALKKYPNMRGEILFAATILFVSENSKDEVFNGPFREFAIKIGKAGDAAGM